MWWARAPSAHRPKELDADHGISLNRSDDRRALALTLARLATGTIPPIDLSGHQPGSQPGGQPGSQPGGQSGSQIARKGTLGPLPSELPENLRVLIRGLATPLAQSGMTLEHVQSHIDQHQSLQATPETMRALYQRTLAECLFEESGRPEDEGDGDVVELDEVEELDVLEAREPTAASAREPAGMGMHGVDEAQMATLVARVVATMSSREPAGAPAPLPRKPWRRQATQRSTQRAPRGLLALALACGCALGAAVTAVTLTSHPSPVEEVRVTRARRAQPNTAASAQPSRAAYESDGAPGDIQAGERMSSGPKRSAPGMEAGGETSRPVTGLPPARLYVEPTTQPNEDRAHPSEVSWVEPATSDQSGYVLTGEPFSISATARTADIEVSADQGVWLSRDTALLSIRVRNRGSLDLHIATPRLRGPDGQSISSAVTAARLLVESGEHWIVPGDTEGSFALEIKNADRLSGQRVFLDIDRPDGTPMIVLGALQWP